MSLVTYNPDKKVVENYQANLQKFINVGVFGGSLQDEKSVEIQKSNQAKNYFLRPENMEKFKKQLETKKLNSELVKDTVEDSDSIEYYNRKYKKDNLTSIPGCFV